MTVNRIGLRLMETTPVVSCRSSNRFLHAGTSPRPAAPPRPPSASRAPPHPRLGTKPRRPRLPDAPRHSSALVSQGVRKLHAPATLAGFRAEVKRLMRPARFDGVVPPHSAAFCARPRPGPRSDPPLTRVPVTGASAEVANSPVRSTSSITTKQT